MKHFLNKARIYVEELREDVRSYLRDEYGARNNLFTPASPYGQVLEVFNNISQLVFFYIEDAITELNVRTAQRRESIYGLARLTGHNPTRAISAQGELSFKFNQSAKSQLNGSVVILPNWTTLKSTNNGFKYLIKLDADSIKVPVAPSNPFKFKVVQGEIEEQTATSDGTRFQSFNFTSKKRIDNDNVFVYVNGEQATIRSGLWDMIPGENAAMVKTGIGGGIDVIFGNGHFGRIPPEGATIKVEYVITDGGAGTLGGNRTGDLDFNFEEELVTELGESVDMNELSQVRVEKPIILGSSGEDPQLTKNILGSNNRALVLANPENFVHYLSRYDLFSYIEAESGEDNQDPRDDNVYYLFLVPNVKKRVREATDYYQLPIDRFKLTEDERSKTKEVINESGRLISGSELSIIEPDLSRYVVNVFASLWDNVGSIEAKKAEVQNVIAEYALNVTRRDKYPKSDIISLLEERVDGLDSLSVQFVSERNELAIKNGYYFETTFEIDQVRGLKTPVRRKVELSEGEDPRLGLNDFGDVVIGKRELPVFRGGWTDRNGNEYKDGITTEDGLSSVNLFIDSIVKADINTSFRKEKLDELKNKDS